jgi:cyanophycin synthetase
MKVLHRSVYVGPSLYAHFPVIRLELDLEAAEAWPTSRLGAPFVDALVAALPGLGEHGCSYGEPGGLIRRMTEGEGTWLGHVLEHLAIELQNIAGIKVTFGKTRETSQPGIYDVVYEFEQREVGVEAGDVALQLLHSLLPLELRPRGFTSSYDWPAERDAFIKYAQRRALGPSTAALVAAAEARNIPWVRLNEQSLVQFGHGKYQQRVQATVTGRTPHLAVELAGDKEETNKLLAMLGLPVPRQDLVQNEDGAVRAAGRIGYPVVTKPYNGNHGRAVSIGLTDEAQVREGFRVAQEVSRSVVVESFVQGFDHWLLVVNG